MTCLCSTFLRSKSRTTIRRESTPNTANFRPNGLVLHSGGSRVNRPYQYHVSQPEANVAQNT